MPPSPLRRPGEVTRGQPGETGLSSEPEDGRATDLLARYFVEVGAVLRVDSDMVGRLIDLSKAHYDGKCRSLSEPGGLIYGWLQQLKFAGDGALVEVTATGRQLQLICKVLEAETWSTIDGEIAYAHFFQEISNAMGRKATELNTKLGSER